MVSLKNPSAFFNALRDGGLLGPTLTSSEVDGCNAILTEASKAGWPISWAAYALATAYHETAHTMQPVRENGGDTYFFRMYDMAGNRPQVARTLGNTKPGDGVKYCGRGYPQVTGRANYTKADQHLKLGGLLIDNPDLMLRPEIAAQTMIYFMEAGLFTGASCTTCLMPKASNFPADEARFIRARRIINSTDKAELIAGYADQFQIALSKGAWS